MSFNFDKFENGLNEEFVDWLIEYRYPELQQKYSKLWNYYQNNTLSALKAGVPAGKLNELSRGYIQAQEEGLPPRITGISRNLSLQNTDSIQRKEVVIENDIAWRINAMVDYLFGKGFTVSSKAADSDLRQRIDAVIKAVFSANGGVEFFQNMAVLGSIYGFVDCVLRADKLFAAAKSRGFSDTLKAASQIAIDLVEAPHCLAVLEENDYKKIKFYIQHFPQNRNSITKRTSLFSKLIHNEQPQRELSHVSEILSPSLRQVYQDKELVTAQPNPLGKIPVIHIQNIAQPCSYEGLSDVEPLIPLQDELNTRLSDRANRITLQSFKMYLAKGLEPAGERQILPGRIWCTDNEQAEISEFGGDSASPGENTHIEEVREALDKVSGVTPVAAGVIRGKLGNLTSAVALKMTLMGTLAKTERKRLTYGEGIKSLCKLILHSLDCSGIFKTDITDRDFEVRFPNPLPEDTAEKLNEAKTKMELGIDKQKVLEELGY